MRTRNGARTPIRTTVMRPSSDSLRALLVLAVVAASGACASDPWNDPRLGDAFVPKVQTARRVGRLFEDATPSIPTASGGASLTIADRTLWMVSSLRHGLGRNQKRIGPALVTTEQTDWPGTEDLDVIAAGVPLPGDAYPRFTDGIAVGDGSDGDMTGVVLHYVAVRPGAGAEPGLDYLGAGVATLRDGDVHAASNDGDWRFFGRGDPAFGVAVVQADHGTTTGMDYVFGVRGDAGTDRVYLARVPHGRGAERNKYRFLDADDEWSDSLKDAAPLFRAGPGGLSVAWNEHMRAYLAVYSWAVPGDGVQLPRLRVVARAARHPSGPWSAETRLFDSRGLPAGGRVKLGHGAREHRQLGVYGGRIIFVTVDGGPMGRVQAPSPPRMWRVEFPEVR